MYGILCIPIFPGLPQYTPHGDTLCCLVISDHGYPLSVIVGGQMRLSVLYILVDRWSLVRDPLSVL